MIFENGDRNGNRNAICLVILQNKTGLHPLRSKSFIIKSVLKFFSGEWRCQVTSSSYFDDDALSSRPVRLVVRIPPSEPRIYYNGQFLNKEVNNSFKVSCSKEKIMPT